jgi:hypothetical protein
MNTNQNLFSFTGAASIKRWGVKTLLPISSIAACLLALGTSNLAAQSSGDTLEQGFQNPPDSAKPRVWWHWMNGNISKEGIKGDLEWMKRVGIAGFQNFQVGGGTSEELVTTDFVPERLEYMTPEWKDAFKYAATLADQLGLEMAVASSPGWSATGGPWVPPSHGMKKLVWSEIRVEGGQPFTGTLPKPPSTTGSFQNIGAPSAQTNQYYADSAVVAYRVPDSDLTLAELQPKLTSSGGQFDLAALTDGNLANFTTLPAAPAGEKAWIQFEFAKPQAVRGLSLVTGGGANSEPALEVSDDGQQFREVVAIPRGRTPERTISFPAATGRFFRVSFGSQSSGGRQGGRGGGVGGGTPIAELELYTGARVNRFEEKAGFTAATGLYALATPAVPAEAAIRKGDVLDLTSKMRPDGTLDWTPPAGRWTVLRMGYSLTGMHNHPAITLATSGLEVDKLSRAYTKDYFDYYLGRYKDLLGPLMGKRGLQYVVTDSWEAGVQNWTDDMIAEFAKRRGYDPRPWLPVLTGKVVESAESSDRFLWDFRKTIGELTADCYYGQISASLKERGMGRYSESHESGRAFTGDGMEVKRDADVPMGAMWTTPQGARVTGDADVRESASVAHIYGQNLVAAESFTTGSGPWAYYPELLKTTADRELAMGLNRFVVHTSVHQPSDDKIPGIGLAQFGQWFTRHETWAELALPWTTYLARSCYLLQQGQFVADVAYFYGEDSNITALFGDSPPAIPAGYNFDYINADALVHKLSVKNGRITTPSGMSYRVLALDPGNAQHISLAVLRKIHDLVNAGAVVVGAKPVDSPSLGDNQAEFQTIADQLWGPGVGKGKVYGSQTIAEALAALQVAPDFEYSKPQADTTLFFVHRKVADGEIYWVNNRNPRVENLDATFRVQGKAAEVWHADTGKMEPVSYQMAGANTTVPLRLDPNDALFVVFRKAAATPSRIVVSPVETPLATLEGAWEVRFPVNRGAPSSITLDTLSSWSENADAGVKYFSGTATYIKTIQAPDDWFKSGARLLLDLGSVKNLAEVTVNGQPLGILWKTPFCADMTGWLKPGANTVEIKVTNLWVNRLIGDAQPDAPKKYTTTNRQLYGADAPLLPSGLLGPVRVVSSALE